MVQALDGYTLTDTLHADEDFVLARGLVTADCTPVLIRRACMAGNGSRAALEREFALRAELEPLRMKRSPFVEELDRPVQFDAVWVLPKLVADVRFMDWTSTGHLRHPTWRGIRRDKLPGDL